MLSFQGNTAPYLQNAYVRVRSIFRKLASPWPAIRLKSVDRWGAIEELVAALIFQGGIKAEDRDSILSAIRLREETMSTGVGYGIALPHASSDRVTHTVGVIGRSSTGVDFQSLDGSPVYLVALFIHPANQSLESLRGLAEAFNKDRAQQVFWEPPISVSLIEPQEQALALKLIQFGETVPQVLDDFRPNILANYLFELANTFHAFYEACPVLKAEESIRNSRLALSDLTARILQKGLALMGIQAPEKM
jgi:mannitol/fructose-specific phosphotransferase system IIA component (Ntr-type)